MRSLIHVTVDGKPLGCWTRPSGGYKRFDLLVERIAEQLAQNAGQGLTLSEAREVLQPLSLERDVVLRRHAPRLAALREMGRALDQLEVSWPPLERRVRRLPGISAAEATAGLQRFARAARTLSR